MPVVLGLPHRMRSLVLLHVVVAILSPGLSVSAEAEHSARRVVLRCAGSVGPGQCGKVLLFLARLFCRALRNCCSTHLTVPIPLLQCVTLVVFTLGNSFQNIYMMVDRSNSCGTETAAFANQ